MTGRKPTARGVEFSLQDSEYADDTAVVFDSRDDLETYTPLLIEHFERFGMQVHVGYRNEPNKPSKTEVLFVSAPPSQYVNPESYDSTNLNPIELGNGRFLPVVDKCIYLGTTLSSDCRDTEDITFRIKKAGSAFGALRKCLFTNPDITPSVKRTVYEGLILSLLLYGAESWCLSENLYSMLRIFHNRCLRAMCGVTLRDCYVHHISTDQLLDRMSLRSIDTYVTRRQLRWAGHVARMDFTRLPRRMLSSWVPSKRPIGAPEYTYGRGLYKSLKKAGVDKNNWHDMAIDKSEWRKIIANVE